MDIEKEVVRRTEAGESRDCIKTAVGITDWQIRKIQGKTPVIERVKHLVVDVEEPVLRSTIIRKLRVGWRNLNSLAGELRCNAVTVESVVEHLGESGYMIVRDGPRARIVKEPDVVGCCHTDASPLRADGWRKIGVIADTHLASKYARLDVLEAAYDRFKEEKITDVYHAGNIVDGECKFNQYELLAHGVTDQALYCLDHYPQRSGITTHYITGACHEGWWMGRDGIDFGRYLAFEAGARGRKDLHYLGYMEADVKLVGPNGASSMMRILHPGGGSAYALSYRPQKIIESLQGGEKPAVLIVGHFHKMAQFMLRNVWTILAGTTQDQSPFMRKRSIEAHLGYAVVSMQQDENGAVRRLVCEHTGYYDRGYHEAMSLE